MIFERPPRRLEFLNTAACYLLPFPCEINSQCWVATLPERPATPPLAPPTSFYFTGPAVGLTLELFPPVELQSSLTPQQEQHGRILAVCSALFRQYTHRSFLSALSRPKDTQLTSIPSPTPPPLHR